uniref:Uncharacterized protein n=1 Tax=Aegilops tauschii TaxID=37682 RepID=M8C5D5_AEGTA
MATEQSRYGHRKLMVSYGGKLQRFSEGGGPQYIGGEHQVLPDGTSELLSPALIHRSVSAPSLSPPSTGHDTTSSTTTTTARSTLSPPSTGDDTTSSSKTAGSTCATQDVAPNAAMQRSLARPAPVFLVPVAPVIVYQPVIPVYQVFVVRDCAVHRLNQIRCLPISYDMDSITKAAVQGANQALA